MLSRPIAVTIVAIFLILATGIAVIVGVSLLFPNPLLDRLWELNRPGAALFQSIGRVSGLFLLALACSLAAAARGLLRGRRWSWWFAVVLFSVEVVGNLVSYSLIHDALRTISGAAIATLFLVLLMLPNVRDYFLNALSPNHKP